MLASVKTITIIKKKNIAFISIDIMITTYTISLFQKCDGKTSVGDITGTSHLADITGAAMLAEQPPTLPP